MTKPAKQTSGLARGRTVDAQAKETAAELRRRARLVGAEGRNVTMAQRALRDTAIVATRHAGITQKEVAREFKLSERQVRDIEALAVSRRTTLEDSAMEIVERQLRSYRTRIANFELMALAYVEEHPAAAIRAELAAAELEDRMFVLLGVMGKLPTNLEDLRDHAELERLGQAMDEIVRRLVVGELDAGGVLAEWRRVAAQIAGELPDAEGAACELEGGG